MDVDLERLNHDHEPNAIQERSRSWSERQPDTEVALPIFDVIWGDRRHPVIDIKISGVNGELLELRQEDDSYSRRPADLIRNLNKLLAIPDEEFLKYTPEQRSNLVSEFAAVHYPPITNHQNVQTGALPIKASKGRP